MEKVLIISDSHGLTKEITAIKERHRIKHIIHCGDSELNSNATELDDVWYVAGNCDEDRNFPVEQTIQIGTLNFFVTHGHLYNVRESLLELSYKSMEEHAQVVCYGHTHIAGVEKTGTQLFINPGSIRFPKKRKEASYAIMKWARLDKIKVEFYTTTGNVIEDLTFEGSLL